MLTRLMAASDRPLIETLCAGTPEWDIFLLANLSQLASDGSMVQYWGQFADSGTLTAVLMRYHVLWYGHAGPGADMQGLAKTIGDQGQPHFVLNEGGVEAPQLAPLLTGYQVDLRLPGRLRRRRAAQALAADGVGRGLDAHWPGNVAARRATLGDVDRLAAFYTKAPEDVRRGPDSLRRSITGGRQTYLAEAAGEVVACAVTTAGLPAVAMVGGLFAVPEREREANLGCALQALVGSLAAAGKDACVVTRDPWIDGVLDRLGFETLGPWWMLHMSPSR